MQTCYCSDIYQLTPNGWERRMFSWFRKRRQAQEDVRQEAEILIQAFGREAWQKAYARMRNTNLTQDERTRASRVRTAIEKHYCIVRQPDTATRYLEEGDGI